MAARTALTDHLPAGLDYLVACSGGPDSLTLAATAAHLKSEGVLQGRVGAVVVDHGLQPGSDEVAADAGEKCAELGLSPVIVQRVQVPGTGNEADARQARYEALEEIRAEVGADYILTAHTADDQAEQVLLSLARGSGTRALAGIPEHRGRMLRPLLGITREQTHAICDGLQLHPWHDPTNDLPDARRNRVRHELLPVMREVLGNGVDDALVRTARLARQDADLLDELAQQTLATAAVQDDPSVLGGVDDRVEGRAPLVWDLRRQVVLEAPAALRSRVLRQVAVAVGGKPPTAERTAALEKLTAGTGAPGPVQLDGRVSVTRIRSEDGESLLRFRGL